jgi:EAL domain-containing protein (putative c-di-GMP-specific phosphodiesterase class I)
VVAPSHFIPIAEENGLIIPLGAWVLRQALADAASWPSNIRLAVNLSPIQFGNDSLVADVSGALAHSGVDPGRLELEITETAMLANTETVLAALQQIHNLGVGIALDDFGTGYSSLSYLRCFPFNKVKIDRSFVMDLGRQSGADTITAAIIGLCVRLGLRITAEGVETEDQLERLANLHCTEAQGYLFSRPRPACDVPDMLIRPAAPPSETIGRIVQATL